MKSENTKRISDELKQAVIQYKAGDGDSFGVIYVESKKYVYTCIHNVVKGNDSAQDIIEDMMQDTYVEISKSLGQLEDVERFLQWAGTIATRKCYAYLNKNKRYVLLNEEDTTFEELAGDEKFIPEEMMQSAEKRRLLKDIIDNRLNEMQRICIYEFYYNEKKQSQIAEEYGIPENTVKTHLSRAKAKIKEGVLDLEQNKNTRLYSFAPVFVLLFADELAACVVPETVAVKVLSSPALADSLSAMKQAAGKASEVAATKVIENATAQEAVKRTTGEMVKTAGGEVSKSVFGKLTGTGLAAKLAAGTVGIMMVAGIITGVVVHNNKPENLREVAEVQSTETGTEEVPEETAEEATETEEATTETVEQKVTLTDEQNKRITDLMSNVFECSQKDSGSVNLNDPDMLVAFYGYTMMCNEEYLPAYDNVQTVTDELGNVYPQHSTQEIQEYLEKIFPIGTLDFASSEDYFYGDLDGNIFTFSDLSEGDSKFDVTITKTIKKADGTYEIYGNGVQNYAYVTYLEPISFKLHAEENPESPFEFSIIELTYGVDNETVSETDSSETDGQEEFASFETAEEGYREILSNWEMYPQYYPEYNYDQHPDFRAQTDSTECHPEEFPLWFALADSDGNGVKELYLAHPRGNGSFIIVTNVLQYDSASKLVIDLDGDVLFEPNGMNTYLNKGGVLYSGTEANVDYTFYYNIFTGELWRNNVNNPDWAKQHKAEKVPLEWHEATEENIAEYVK